MKEEFDKLKGGNEMKNGIYEYEELEHHCIVEIVDKHVRVIKQLDDKTLSYSWEVSKTSVYKPIYIYPISFDYLPDRTIFKAEGNTYIKLNNERYVLLPAFTDFPPEEII